MKYEAIVIGVSAGGIEALGKILPKLPKDFSPAVIIVQHMNASSNDFLARYFDEMCSLRVKQADEKEMALPGTVYIAPPNYHLMLEDDRTFSLSIDAPVNFARPSIDILFETAAVVYGARLVGVVLTGASSDGSHGLRAIKNSGGLTVVQDPNTAEADFMPKSAIAVAEPDYVLPLEDIGGFLEGLT
jgi:two-component system, chemotaxis family, protein-glutamate methylesterase/glutaminase